MDSNLYCFQVPSLYTKILENLRNAIVGFYGLRNEFVNVQGNKKLNTQNIQV